MSFERAYSPGDIPPQLAQVPILTPLPGQPGLFVPGHPWTYPTGDVEGLGRCGPCEAGSVGQIMRQMASQGDPNARAYVQHYMGGLHGLGIVPLALFAFAGGAAALAAIDQWMSEDDWSLARYNFMVDKIERTLTEWDQLGWTQGCWQKNPAKRQAWLKFWKSWSDFYARYPKITSLMDHQPWVLDSEKQGVRLHLDELRQWGVWLNANCGAQTGAEQLPEAPKKEDGPVLPSGAGAGTDWGKVAMWGGIGLAAVFGLSLVSTVRGAFK